MTSQKLAWLAAWRPGVIIPVLWHPATSVKVSASGSHLSNDLFCIIRLPLQCVGDGCRSPLVDHLPVMEKRDNRRDGLDQTEDQRQPVHLSYA